MVDVRQQRRLSTAAVLPREVVQIHRPHHAAAQPVGADELGLVAGHDVIVERHPLAVGGGVRSHAAARVAVHLPAADADSFADLQIFG